MTTPNQPSVPINATLADLSTIKIGLPTDDNFGASPANPLYPNGDAPIQIVPGINKNTFAPDVIDAILTYLQTVDTVRVTRPTENLLFEIPGLYQAIPSNSLGPAENFINVNPNMPDTTSITSVNIATTGGDIIRALIDGVDAGSVVIPNILTTQVGAMTGLGINNIPDTGTGPLPSVGAITVTNILDPYRSSTVGTKNAIIVAEAKINSNSLAPGLHTYRIEIVPSPSMGVSSRFAPPNTPINAPPLVILLIQFHLL